jgi:hypothetical protein
MHPEAARLIELTTRPLAGNAELQMAEFANVLGTHAADAITEAADALARADLYPQRRRWLVALVVLPVIHGITGKSRMTFYQDVLLQERLALFPPVRDYVGRIPPTVYAASQTAPGIRLRKLVDVLAAGAQRCAAAGDVEGFRQIVRDWRILGGFLVRNSYLLIDGLIVRSLIGGPLLNFRDAARSLGLEL